MLDPSLSLSGCCDQCKLLALQEDALITTVAAENNHTTCLFKALNASFIYDTRAIHNAAAEFGNIEIFKYGQSRCNKWHIDPYVLTIAAKWNQLDLITYLDDEIGFEWTDASIHDGLQAAIGGYHLNILKYLMAIATRETIVISSRLLIDAIRAEESNILDYLLDSRIPMSESALRTAIIRRCDATFIKMFNLISNGYPLDDDDMPLLNPPVLIIQMDNAEHNIIFAFENQNINLLLADQVNEEQPEQVLVNLFRMACTEAARYGNIRILEYLHNRNPTVFIQVSETMLFRAIQWNHYYTVNYLIKVCPLTTSVLMHLCSVKDSPHKLTTLQEINPALFNQDHMAAAAKTRNMVTLNYLLYIDCPYDEHILDYVVTQSIWEDMPQYASVEEKATIIIRTIIDSGKVPMPFIQNHPIYINYFRDHERHLAAFLSVTETKLLPPHLIDKICRFASLVPTKF